MRLYKATLYQSRLVLIRGVTVPRFSFTRECTKTTLFKLTLFDEPRGCEESRKRSSTATNLEKLLSRTVRKYKDSAAAVTAHESRSRARSTCRARRAHVQYRVSSLRVETLQRNRSTFLNYANAALVYYYIYFISRHELEILLVPLYNIFKINFKFSKRQRVRQQQQQQCIESGSI
ncbi:unnamed protein product [Trichogramma brassicae]|uniref:Uncharacterized protein n=1 Tax=Trichogramma brassicae TaxID=86971 RepID=A0A6H5J5G8_9HYME|nr:unnamed protein product [Trichogramma brassicae]